jgi:hypothetical protein
MLIQIYIYHQWKSFIRNARWRRNLLSKLLLAILVFFVLSTLSILGYNIDKILLELGGDPIATFNSFLIPYLFTDFFFRFFFQSDPSIYFIPYLRFRVRHTKLVTLMIFRSLWSIFNIIPWLLVIPFTIKILFVESGLKTAIPYLFAIFLLILINNFLTAVIQFLIRKRKLFYFIPICIAILLFNLPRIGVSIKTISISLGNQITEYNSFIFVSLLTVLIFIICLLRHLLLSGFYVDELSYKNLPKGLFFSPNNLNLFSKLGKAGNYLSLEIKLLLRNKRPKQTIGIYPILPIFFIISLLNNNVNTFFTLLLLTFSFGLLSILYGQYIFSWESTYFDLIMTRRINFCEFIKAKYYLMILFTIVIFLLMIPLFLLFFRIYIICLFSMFIFSIGTVNFIVLLSGAFNEGRINLNESFFFNYQGLNSNQLFLPIIVFGIPVGLYTFVNLLTNSFLANILLLVIGLIFLIFHNWWINNIILEIFKKRKYKNLEGFRKLMN